MEFKIRLGTKQFADEFARSSPSDLFLRILRAEDAEMRASGRANARYRPFVHSLINRPSNELVDRATHRSSRDAASRTSERTRDCICRASGREGGGRETRSSARECHFTGEAIVPPIISTILIERPAYKAPRQSEQSDELLRHSKSTLVPPLALPLLHARSRAIACTPRCLGNRRAQAEGTARPRDQSAFDRVILLTRKPLQPLPLPLPPRAALARD